jgi:hypothetical protein
MKNFKPQTRAPKGALCACGDRLGPHFLAAGGGSVPESRAPWAPEPGFTDPTWSALLREMVDAAPGYLRKKGDEALRYMAERAAPYYGGQRGVNGAANLKEQLDMAAGALRGASAATIGLPGDLQSLGRGAMAASQGPLATLSAMQEHTLFPKSEELKKGERGFLARGAGTPGERAGEVLGDFIPLVPPSAVGAGVRAARSGAVRAGKGIEAATERALADPGLRGDLVRKFGPMLAQPPARAVKPRGGNFDSGALNRWLVDLGIYPDPTDDSAPRRWVPEDGRAQPVQAWGRKQLANYARKDLGAPTDPLLAVEREFPTLHFPEDGDLRTHYRLDAERVNDHLAAIRNPPPLPPGFRPHKSEMDGLYRALDTESGEVFGKGGVTPEEGMREAAVDFALNQVRGRGTLGKIARKHASLTNDPMTAWGMMSGRIIDEYGSPAAYVRQAMPEYGHYAHLLPGGVASEVPVGMPEQVAARARKLEEGVKDGLPEWLTRAAPDTKFYGGLDEPLGFDHVLDYLEAATEAHQTIGGGAGTARLSPEILARVRAGQAGTPADRRMLALQDAGLALDPASLPRLSVADAVRKTAQWNKFMAEQGVADGPLSKGWKVHKEYPGDAGKGMKWVEFGKPEVDPNAPLPEGWRIHEYSPGRFVLRAPDGAPDLYPAIPAATFEQALRNGHEYLAKTGVREGLGAEGDAMGHCVGGYCDDVLNRGTKIYSLRDAKGKPHVTIEVRPSNKDYDNWYDRMPAQEFRAMMEEYARPRGLFRPGMDEKDVIGPEWAAFTRAKYGKEPQLEIVQIKGKGNAAPVDEYLPFVQDFVRSGKWGRVGDLRNTGLIELPKGLDLTSSAGPQRLEPGHYTSDELRAFGRRVNPKATEEQIDSWMRPLIRGAGGNYAHGGRVEPDVAPGFLPRNFDEMVDYTERIFRAHAAA